MRLRAPCALAAGVLALAALAAAAETASRPARTLEDDGVVIAFPAVVYRSWSGAGDSPAATGAAIASAALGVPVDAERDLVAVTGHRVVLRDPDDSTHLLKVYRTDAYDPEQIAKLVQRELALEAFLTSQGLRVAAIDPTPRLVERGVIRQQRIDGVGLDERYPQGYRRGDDPAVDRVLARVAGFDRAVARIVSRESGLVFTNTVDCHTERPLGIDLGHCYGNIFLERGSGEPVFVDW